MIYGYGRVSTNRQELDIQLKALKEAGAMKIYKEKTSGAKKDKKQLNLLLSEIKAGDTLVVTKADRIARSLSQLEKVVTDLTDRGVTVNILNMGIFTATTMDNPMTKLLFNVLGAFAEFERSMIIERTQEGIKAAKEKGVKFGRKKKKYKLEGALLHTIENVESGKMSRLQAAEYTNCSMSTLKRRLKEYRLKQGIYHDSSKV